MNVFSIHFRLDDKHLGNYQERYDRLQQVIDSLGAVEDADGSAPASDATTSTRWIRSQHQADTIAKTLATVVDRRFDVIQVKPADAAIIYLVGESVDAMDLRLETKLEVVQV